MLTEIHGKISYQQPLGQSGLFVVELGIGNVNFPEAIIDHNFGYFALVPRDKFDLLEATGVIRDAQAIRYPLKFGGYLDRAGYADVWVIGTEESVMQAKLYKNATITRSEVEDVYRTYLGMPFVNDFDMVDFNFDTNSGLRLNKRDGKFEIELVASDNKEGFYGYRDGPVRDLTDLLVN